MLAPAYDLFATRLLISEKDDPEEMALTINGKKTKLNSVDFEKFSENLGMNIKQRTNIFRRFQSALPPAIEFIKQGFLSPEKREELQDLLLSRSSRIGIDIP